MKSPIVAVRDIKTNQFGRPETVNHLAAAVRNFEDACRGTLKSGDPVYANHPEDFELYLLGWYDDNSGEFEKEKKQLAVGSNFKRA